MECDYNSDPYTGNRNSEHSELQGMESFEHSELQGMESEHSDHYLREEMQYESEHSELQGGNVTSELWVWDGQSN